MTNHMTTTDAMRVTGALASLQLGADTVVAKLWWDGDNLFAGTLYMGSAYEIEPGRCGWVVEPGGPVGDATSMTEARAELKTRVRAGLRGDGA